MIVQAFALLHRDIILALRNRGEIAAPLVFMALIITLFPFALGPAPDQLARLAPGLLALALLLSLLLGGNRLFAGDYENGTLDLLVQSRLPFPLYVLIKTALFWLTHVFPLLLVSPLFMLFLAVPADAFCNMLLAFAVGTAPLTLLSMLGQALTLGARRANLLLPLLLIPFYVPALTFTVSMAQHGLQGEGAQAFFFLLAQFFLYLGVFPFLAASALRACVEAS
jgi:heme exporter protein B